MEGVLFRGKGFASDDGTLVFNSGSNQDFNLIAEGQIDPDTFRIEGIYATGTLVGEVRGRYAD